MSQFAYDYESNKLRKYNETPIQEDGFARWSKENFYRTSYINHFTEKPLEPKNVAIPGYQGFIPGMYSNNEYSKTYSRITRERLANPDLGKNPLCLSSTGFNHKKHNFIDPTRTASTHKYGAQTMLATHPCMDAGKWISQNKETYNDFRNSVPPTYRDTNQFFTTNNPVTMSSGFKKNHDQFDGKGWKPHKVLDGNRKITEYRHRYNQQKPFHRDPELFSVRKMNNTIVLPDYKHHKSQNFFYENK